MYMISNNFKIAKEIEPPSINNVKGFTAGKLANELQNKT